MLEIPTVLETPTFPATMEVTTEAERAIVTVSGQIDAAVTEDLQVRLEEQLVTRPGTLVVDLTGVTFCSVTGLRVLLTVHNAAESAGIPCVLVAAQRALLRPVKMLGLDRVLRIRPSLAEI